MSRVSESLSRLDKTLDACSEWSTATIDGWTRRRAWTPAVVSAALRHKVPGAVLEAARRQGRSHLDLPPEVAAWLGLGASRISLDEFSRRLVLWDETQDQLHALVLSVVVRTGSEVMLTKGSALRELVPTYRRYAADIDIVVQPADAVAVARELSRHGLTPAKTLRVVLDGTSSYSFAMTGRIRGFHVEVEVHWAYLGDCPDDCSVLPSDFTVARAWKHAAPSKSHACVRIPRPEDLVLLQLLELTSNPSVRLRDACDFAVLVDACPAGFAPALRREIATRRLEAHWIATAHLVEAALAGRVLDDTLAPGCWSASDRLIARCLSPQLSPKRLLRPLIPTVLYVYNKARRAGGPWRAMLVTIQYHLRVLVRRLLGVRTADLLARPWTRAILFAQPVRECQMSQWSVEDLETLLLRSRHDVAGLCAHAAGDAPRRRHRKERHEIGP